MENNQGLLTEAQYIFFKTALKKAVAETIKKHGEKYIEDKIICGGCFRWIDRNSDCNYCNTNGPSNPFMNMPIFYDDRQSQNKKGNVNE